MREVTTFLGMDAEVSPELLKPGYYMYGENFKLFVDKTNNSLQISSGAGPKLVAYSELANIVHITSVLEYVVIFLAPKGNQSGTHYIYRIHNSDLEVLSNGNTPVEIVNSVSPFQLVLSADDLRFGTSISSVSSVESDDEYYLYFVSNTAESPVRKINIKLNYGNLISGIDKINLFKNTYLYPLDVSITSGALKTGTYRYTYCLFEKNGSETEYASPTKPLFITSDSLDSPSTSFMGSESGINSGKGVKISLTNLRDYYVRVVRMYWADNINLPICTIVYEGTGLNNQLSLVDDGTQNLGTIPIEEIAQGFTSVSAKQLTSKNGRLFLGNIKEYSFDFEIDTRAYRYNSYGTIVLNNSAGVGAYASHNLPTNYKEYYECFNPYNSLQLILPIDEQCKFKKNGWTLGGEGPVISFEFVTSEYKFTDVSVNDVASFGNPYFFKLSNVRNHIPPQAHVGYQRDEIYRFGIVFYNDKGQQTPVKWIEDIRFPNHWEFPIISRTDRTRYVVLGIRFTVDHTKLPSEVIAYQIVRAVRTKDNSTVIDCGILSTFKSTSTSGVIRLGNFGPNGNISTDMTKSAGLKLDEQVIQWVDFISPETAYFKEYREKGDIVDLYPTRKIPKNVAIVNNDPNKETQWSSPVAVTILQDTSSVYTYPYYITDSYYFEYRKSSTPTVPLPFDGLQMYLYTAELKTDANNRAGNRYSSMMLKLDRLISGWPKTSLNHPAYAVRKRLIYPYGGYTQSAKDNTTYIPCSHMELKSNNTIDVYNGDTFIGIFEYMYAMHDNKVHSKCIQPVCVQTVIESRINLWYKGSLKVSDRDVGRVSFHSSSQEIFNARPGEFAHWCIQEKSGIYPINKDETQLYTQPSDLYVYNSVYSSSDPKVYKYPKNSLSNTNTNFAYRIIGSLKKHNSALSDTWSKLQLNNYIDLDPKYGQINALIDIRPGLMAFQDKAVATIPVDERILLPDTGSGGIVAGKSSNIDRYDYLSTNYGTTSNRLVAFTPSGVFFIDPKEKIFGKVIDSFEIISRTNKIQSLIDKEPFTGTLSTVYDDELEEVLFVVGNKSYLYSLKMGTFVSVLDSVYNGYTQQFNNTIGYTTNSVGSNLYILNKGKSGYYKTDVNRLSTPSRSRFLIRFALAPKNGMLSRLDSILVNGVSLDQNGQPSDYILNQLLVNNNYQSTGIIQLTPSNFEHRYRTWRINTLRGSLTSSYMIDYYHIIEFRLDNPTYEGEILIKSVFNDYKPVFNR